MKTGYQTKADKDKLEEIKGKRDPESKAIRDQIKSKKGKIQIQKNFAIFDGTSWKTQYSRYSNISSFTKGSPPPVK